MIVEQLHNPTKSCRATAMAVASEEAKQSTYFRLAPLLHQLKKRLHQAFLLSLQPVEEGKLTFSQRINREAATTYLRAEVDSVEDAIVKCAFKGEDHWMLDPQSVLKAVDNQIVRILGAPLPDYPDFDRIWNDNFCHAAKTFDEAMQPGCLNHWKGHVYNNQPVPYKIAHAQWAAGKTKP